MLICQVNPDMMVRAGKVSLPPARLDSPRITLLEAEHAMATAYPIVPGVTFKLVAAFPSYCIGDNGEVWSCKTKVAGRGFPGWRASAGPGNNGWFKMTPGVVEGYSQVTLWDNGRTRQVKVHLLVMEAFVGPRPEGCQACHNDGNRLNNHVSNLRWDTPGANCADRDKHGTTRRGSSNGNSKLTEDDVRQIRALSASGWNPKRIAGRYGVSNTLIRFIVNRRNWTHV